jgi:hypothetical protein
MAGISGEKKSIMLAAVILSESSAGAQPASICRCRAKSRKLVCQCDNDGGLNSPRIASGWVHRQRGRLGECRPPSRPENPPINSTPRPFGPLEPPHTQSWPAMVDPPE